MKASSLLSPIAKRLEGKVALITGGASGIGETTARLFSLHGATVVIADVQEDLGHSLSKDITSDTGQQVSYVHCDVTKDSDIENAVNTAVTKHGKLDIMFNNAGITGNYDPRISVLDRQDFRKVLDVNLYGAFIGAKYAAKAMIPRRNGSILFTASVATVRCALTPHPYTASKHAVVGFTKNLCRELGQYGIRVNCISPAGTPTPMMVAAAGAKLEKLLELQGKVANLKGVNLETIDIAQAALYLGSDESRYVSGLNLVVDGGLHLRHSDFVSLD